MAIAYLGLGSNLGDRKQYLKTAISSINLIEETRVTNQSSIVETMPYGKTDQPNFMNVCVEIETKLTPLELLDRVLSIEHKIGRVREEVWGPRVIDIDILLYEDLEISLDDLQIPHKEMHLREFVLDPLSEIAPKVVHPTFKKTVLELKDELKK